MVDRGNLAQSEGGDERHAWVDSGATATTRVTNVIFPPMGVVAAGSPGDLSNFLGEKWLVDADGRPSWQSSVRSR